MFYLFGGSNRRSDQWQRQVNYKKKNSKEEYYKMALDYFFT